MAIHKKTSINIQVSLDENNVPEKMQWTAQDGGILNQETQALLLSFWDAKTQETLKMDLWVKEMPVDQMQKFFHQTLVALSRTFYKATQDEKMTATMQDFCDYFAEKLNLKKEN
ncbi:MAG: gliding motility protein GldC [Flavobacteriaceae bacterium]